MVFTHAMTIVPDGHTTGTVSTSTESFRYIWPGAARGCRIDVERESETGTCTLAMNVMWVNQGTGDVNALLDQAGGAIALNDYADGETGKRFIVITSNDALGDDADGVLVVGNNTYYRQSLPFEMQLDFVTGGTSVINVYNCQVTWLT